MIRSILGCLLIVSKLVNANALSTTTASYQQLPLERWFDGTVEAVKQATVSAQTSGRVSDIFFDVGDTVPAGSVIIRLVSNEQRDALNQAQAKLSQAQSNLEAQTKDFARLDELYKRNVISKSEWDQASARHKIAQAVVTDAQAALKTAKEQLSYTEIRAPYGGVVSARHVELGEAVLPGTALMSGFDPNAMRILTSLPQAVFDKVRTLKKAQIKSDDGTTLIPSKIILYPIADPATSSINVRLELPEETTKLYPGEFVKVGFTVGDIKRLLIPQKSIVYRSEVTGVYVIKNKLPSLRQIRLGNQFEDKIEVLAGLEDGEVIALDPVAAGIVLHEAIGKNHD